MAKTKTIGITIEMLQADGWVLKNDNPIVKMEKVIPNRNPLNSTPEDTDIKLIIHGMYNSTTFAILFPDGGMLNFVANSMKELKEFEKRIDFYDCPY